MYAVVRAASPLALGLILLLWLPAAADATAVNAKQKCKENMDRGMKEHSDHRMPMPALAVVELVLEQLTVIPERGTDVELSNEEQVRGAATFTALFCARSSRTSQLGNTLPMR